jgi:geranylgeranyl diphosphate synthase type I
MVSCSPDPDALAGELARYGELVNTAMRAVLEPYDEPVEFYGMMRYHLGWVNEHFAPIDAPRGKGLRAALLLLVGAALGGEDGTAAPLAAAVELLHNFSLVHDDIEDGSATRRHRPTVWSIWGAPLGINVGDGLFSLAHLALFGSSLRYEQPERFIEIAHRFEHTVRQLCEGQHLDMSFERRSDVSVDEYLRMIGGKSAALIASAAWIGARAAPGSSAQAADAAGRFGMELGLAFQMQDDILGIWGDEAITGKSAVSDVASRKKTLPVLLALAHAETASRTRLRALYSSPSAAGADVSEIMAILDEASARERAAEHVQRHYAAAMAALDEIGAVPDARDCLRRFAELCVDRSA